MKVFVTIFIFMMISINSYANIICTYNFGQEITLDNITSTEYSRAFQEKDLTYKVYVKNINKFDEVEDYMTIINKKGHKITYSLNCRK